MQGPNARQGSLITFSRLYMSSWLEAIAIRLEAIATRVEAVPIRVEAVAIKGGGHRGWRPFLLGWRP